MIRGADLGVKMINNVGPMADSNVLGRLAAHQGISYLAMHMHGTPKSMQAAPLSRHAALKGVARFFAASERTLLDSGFEQKNIWLDPGIGFGKTDSANLGLIGQLDSWAQQYNVAVGVSRKSMFDRIFGVKSVSERDGPSKVLECCMWQAGARLIRTHDVARLAKVRQILTSVE
jgi:dihydropteroate synthase